VRRFPLAGSGAIWSHRTGDLFIVYGLLSRVFVSARGEAPPRLLFRMPRRQGILTIDVE
jgi:hypothetical protein